MNVNAIVGALIAAAILGGVVFGLEKYVLPPIEGYIPESLAQYKYIVLGLLIILVAGSGGIDHCFKVGCILVDLGIYRCSAREQKRRQRCQGKDGDGGAAPYSWRSLFRIVVFCDRSVRVRQYSFFHSSSFFWGSVTILCRVCGWGKKLIAVKAIPLDVQRGKVTCMNAFHNG